MNANIRIKILCCVIFASVLLVPLATAPQTGAQDRSKPAAPPSSFTPVVEEPFDVVLKRDKANRARVMAAARKLLEDRYDLTRRVDPNVKMTRGKPIPVGPTARLGRGVTWEQLGNMSPEEIRDRDLFPYLPLPHIVHSVGGMVFPQEHVKAQPRLERFDMEFDIPEHFLPEFPPAIFLTTRPDLGDVSKGQLVTINNFYDLFNGILNPKQLDGLRLLVTQFPQQQFNATADRKTERADGMQGVTCFDCHVNGHTLGAAHLVGDIRPQENRRRIETPSLRGVNIQRLFGSQRALKTVEDFTEFEQRAAYFDGDPVLASKEGSEHPRPRLAGSRHGRVSGAARLPARAEAERLRPSRPAQSDRGEVRGEELFFGKAKCAECHTPPFYTDGTMHDLQVERFFKPRMEGGMMITKQGPIKTFPLRGIKESPPYLHDGRLLTLEDTVEFFNLVLETRLNAQEKSDLVAFMRAL